MKIFTYIFFTILVLTVFSCFAFSQEMTDKQKQILERIKQQDKAEEQKRDEIRNQLGLDKEKEDKSGFFWAKGLGLTTKNIAQNRDIGQFIKGGHIDCREWAKSDEFSSKCTNTALRDFIWKMWSEKKRGYITISGDSVDAGATSHFFIEPDKKGNFQIIERIVRWSAFSGNSIDDFPAIVSVERIESKTLQDQWSLILKDKSGKTTKYGY